MTRRGITKASAERFQLGYDGYRLTIPYLTPVGPWQIKYRCIAGHDCAEEGHPKYSYDEGSEQHLFNSAALLAASSVIITEGELDAITLEQHGLPAVAYPGAQTWKANPHWVWCFDSAEELVVLADGDSPGRTSARVVAASLRESVSADVRTVELPDGEDANSFIHQHGIDDLLIEMDWA